MGSFAFSPTLIPSLVTLVMLVVLVKLGFWQLGRAEYKEIVLQTFHAQTELAEIALSELDPEQEQTRFRQVFVSGRYDGQHQILLDNQIHQGQPGYHVLTPFKIDGSDAVILVNRGWQALGNSRQQLPDSSVTHGPVTIHGRIAQPANPGLRLATISDQVWPKVVQSVDYEALSEILPYRLIKAIILLNQDQNDGYVRVWRPDFGSFGPQRHYAYAVQWFALALTLCVIYLVVNIKRQRQQQQKR